MAQNQVHSAHIRLDPPDLGVIEVRVSVNGDQASIAFTSPHTTVRDSVEAAIPRLRDMLGEGGLQLADVSVGHRSNGHGREASQFGNTQPTGGGWTHEEMLSATPLAVGRGLLDCYA